MLIYKQDVGILIIINKDIGEKMNNKINIKEKTYNLLNELNEYANGTYEDDGELIEDGIFGSRIYKLNAPILETSKGKFTIVGYELHILDGVLWGKFQEECISNGVYIF